MRSRNQVYTQRHETQRRELYTSLAELSFKYSDQPLLWLKTLDWMVNCPRIQIVSSNQVSHLMERLPSII